MHADHALSFLVALGLFCGPGVRHAEAHAGALPEALDLLTHGGGSGLSLEASFGLITSEDGNDWRWLCHETIVQTGAFVTPRYARNRDGVLLATLGVLLQGQDPQESLYRSIDGCDWAPVSGTRDDVVTAIGFDPSDDEVALAASGSMVEGETNGIKRSVDGGATFAPTSAADLDERMFRSLRISPAGADAGGSTAWATAMWFDPVGAWLYRSTDGGLTWEEHPQDIQDAGEAQILLDVAEVHPTDPLVAWIRVDGQLEDRLMRTDDGGVSFVEVFRAAGDLLDVLREPSGTIWVATFESGVHRALDGETFVELTDAPVTDSLAYDASGVLLALYTRLEDHVIVSTADGSTFEPVLNWHQLVGPLECAEGSDSATFCDPNWATVQLSLAESQGDDDGPAGDDDSDGDDDGCCPDGASMLRTDDPEAAVLVALVGLFGLRRRRERPDC